MRTKAIWAAALAAVLGGGLSAYAFGLGAGSGGPADPNRPDCPGQVVCPITGELVCRDQCPLSSGSAESEGVPSCCQSGE